MSSKMDAISSSHRDSADNGGRAILPSNLKGVNRSESGRYYAQLVCKGVTYNAGTYNLASDAALACDKALKLIKGSNAKPTFTKEQDHKKWRAAELTRTGLKVDLCAVRKYMSVMLDAAIAKNLALGNDNSDDGDEAILASDYK